MDVVWSVAAPTGGRSAAVPTRSGHEAYLRQLAMLMRQPSCYTEVSRQGFPYPLVALSISKDLAVVHRFDDAQTCLLLAGTDEVAAQELRDFPVHDDQAVFTSEFITTAARGVDVLTSFVQGADLDGLGEWRRL